MSKLDELKSSGHDEIENVKNEEEKYLFLNLYEALEQLETLN